MDDPDVYENGTLKNLLGIKDYDKLKEAEVNIGYLNLISAQKELASTGKRGTELIKSVHRHIFKDIFSWAGEYRKVPIFKTEVVIPGVSLQYSDPKNIDKDLSAAINDLEKVEWEGKSIKEKSQLFTKYLAKIWRVHPFRDGNTRTTLAYASVFARQHGFEMDLGSILNELSRKIDPETNTIKEYSVRDRFVLAALDENCSPEPEYLEYVVRKAILVGAKKKKRELEHLLNEHEQNEGNKSSNSKSVEKDSELDEK